MSRSVEITTAAVRPRSVIHGVRRAGHEQRPEAAARSRDSGRLLRTTRDLVRVVPRRAAAGRHGRFGELHGRSGPRAEPSGIDARVVTIGLGHADGRDEFVDIPFHSVAHLDDIGELPDTIVFVSEAPPVVTRRPAYQILHVPPPLRARERAEVTAGTRDRILIATSRFAADLWASFLDVDVATVHVVHPFAEPVFGVVPRIETTDGRRRILYADG